MNLRAAVPPASVPVSRSFPAAVNLTLRGGRTLPLSSPAVLEAFFATTSYWLERDGWGTRFPYLMDRLNAGRVGPGEIPALREELRTAEAELRGMPVRRVVWDYQDRRHRSDAGQSVNRAAGNLADYFATVDGAPLLTRLQEALEEGRQRWTPLRLSTARARREVAGGWALLLGGLAVGGLVQAFFPGYVLTGHGTSSPHGPLIWMLAYGMAAAGMVVLAGAQLPALAAWSRRHSRLVVTFAVAFSGWLLWFAWR